MKWYTDLYLGKSIAPRYRMLQYKISHRLIHPTVYLIALVQREGRLLEIIPSTCLLQPVYPQENLYILGMAGSRQEAVNLTCEILEAVFKERGNFDLRAWLYPFAKEGSL